MQKVDKSTFVFVIPLTDFPLVQTGKTGNSKVLSRFYDKDGGSGVDNGVVVCM